jgi:hypothetical protein
MAGLVKVTEHRRHILFSEIREPQREVDWMTHASHTKDSNSSRKSLTNFLLRATAVVQKSRMRLASYNLVTPELLTSSLDKLQALCMERCLTSIREVGVWDFEVMIYVDTSCWNLILQ